MKCSTNLLHLSFTMQQLQLVPRLLLRKKQNTEVTHQLTTSMPSVTRMGTTVPDSVMGAGFVMGPGKYAQCHNNNIFAHKVLPILEGDGTKILRSTVFIFCRPSPHK